MPQAQLIQNSFNSGEISPLAFGRSDSQPYKHALAKCRNMIPTAIGPVTKRPGSRYVAAVANEDNISKLIDYAYSDVQAYMFELADLEIRFFTPVGGGGWIQPPEIEFDGSRIDTTANSIGIAQAHFLKDGAGPFQFNTDGTLPDPLAIDTDYYVVLAAVGAGAASFGVSLTSGGAAVSLTDTGTLGAQEFHYLTPANTVIQSVVTPYTITQVWELDFVPSGDILYLTHKDHPPYQLERRAGNGFRMREVFFRDGPYDQININTGQTMDPQSASPALTQSEPNDFSPGDVSLSGETPANTFTVPFHGYEDQQGPLEIKTTGAIPTAAGLATETALFVSRVNEHQFTLALTAGGADLVITARGSGVHTLEGRSADTLVMLADIFNTDSPSKEKGRRFRYREGLSGSPDFNPEWSWGIIDTVVDGKNTSVQVHRAWASNAAEKYFRMGAFWTGNYPSYCSIHEQRLLFASTPSHPNTIWGSQIGDFTFFAPDEGIDDHDDVERLVTDASAITFTLGAGQVDRLTWLSSVRQLIIGTTGAIWPVQASSQLEALTPSNINARASSVMGSTLVKPVNVSDEIVYVSSTTHKLLAMGFDFERDAVLPQDLSILASHFTEKSITQLAFTEEPNPVIWGARTDGLLIGITYERNQRVLGWSGHTLGGVDAKVKSVASTTDIANNYDQLWMVVERTINGNTRRYIEFLEKPFYTDTKLEDAAFLDSALVPYEGAPITQVTGLDHLEGEMVYALADGGWVGELTVVGGQITLPAAASKIRVGLNYNAYIKTLPLEAQGAPGGTLIDRTKRLIEAWARLHRSNYVQIGDSLDNMKKVKLRNISDVAEDPVPLRTLDVSLLTQHGTDIDQSFYIGSDKPVPLDLIGLTGRFEWGAR